MEHTLVLNATYEPLQVVSWKRAMRMLFQDKVEVVAEYERPIHAISITIQLPSVLRLRQYVKIRRSYNRVRFTRANLYARDGNRCQYCGIQPALDQLTYDHVIPVARGGLKTWENITTCCIDCNRRKGNQSPSEVGLVLLRQPKAPFGFPYKIHLLIRQPNVPESWKDYIFWHGETP